MINNYETSVNIILFLQKEFAPVQR
jgi:hypothetical protein